MTQYETCCHSCGVPLSEPDAQGLSDKYCAYCTDSEGHLKSWEEVLTGMAAYLDSWQHAGPHESHKRAVRYLTSMPAWADKAPE